mgnify:CR=1 FL=1
MQKTRDSNVPFEPDEQLLHYHGRSMWPLFREGDLLVVRPVACDTLRVGDCIAFRTNGSDSRIVHRITGLGPAIRTKGDHLAREDDSCVSAAEIEGRVVARIRLGKRANIAAGWWGRVSARGLQWLARLDPARDARLGRCARMIRAVLAPLAARRLAKAATVRFATESGGQVERLVLGGRPVATFDDQARVWRVDWPSSLWIDPQRLPGEHG